MRLFNLFMRRAGVNATGPRVPSGVSRFTVECSRHALADVRKRIFSDFSSAGLQVTSLEVSHGKQHDVARTCVTVRCLPAQRHLLMDRARQISAYPNVRDVRWGDHRRIALN